MGVHTGKLCVLCESLGLVVIIVEGQPTVLAADDEVSSTGVKHLRTLND